MALRLQLFSNAKPCGASGWRSGGDRAPLPSSAGDRRVSSRSKHGFEGGEPRPPRAPKAEQAAALASPAHRVHFHVERGASQAPLSPPPPPQRLCRRGRPGLPPPFPARRPRLCLARRRARSQQGGWWRPEEANGPARPPLSGRSRRRARQGAEQVRAPVTVRAAPRWSAGSPQPPSRATAGTGVPRTSSPSPGGPRRAPITLRPCQGLRLPPGASRPRRSARDGTRGREGGRGWAPGASPRCRRPGAGGPGAGALREGMPRGPDARVFT